LTKTCLEEREKWEDSPKTGGPGVVGHSPWTSKKDLFAIKRGRKRGK